MTYSVIIPYQHSVERLPLLSACLRRLSEVSDNKLSIYVHEVGPQRYLNLPNRYNYLFTKYTDIFHRAWALNRCARTITSSSDGFFILMDGDLIVDESWVDEVLSNSSSVSVGWGKLSLLSSNGTKQYLYSLRINRNEIVKTKTPSLGRAAGAITVISVQLFNEVKGLPEDFAGTWGGEDNVFWSKLSSLGHKPNRFKSEIFHLHHSPSTPRVKEIQRKALSMIHWKSPQWHNYISTVGNDWGLETVNDYMTPSIDYISSTNGPRLTIAMLSWLRYDKLIQTLTSLSSTLTIPTALMLMVQGSERLTPNHQRDIKHLANKFFCNEVFFTSGNAGTGPARATLLERALRRFRTPYINLADDDTTFTPNSVEATIELLDKDPSIGVAGIRYKQNIYRLNSLICPTRLVTAKAIKPIEYVDSTGSASAIIRRELFDLCKIDTFYGIGQWDLDLFLQARSIGWKIVNVKILADMRAINDYGGCNEYRAARLNRGGIRRSLKYFKGKWGLL